MANENHPFAWRFATIQDSQTDVFNNLIRNQKSSMSENDARNLARVIPYFGDLEKDIQLIKDARTNLMKLVPSFNKNDLKDAYPFELLFQYRF